MTITKFVSLLACGAVLALGACTDTKTVPVGDPTAVAAEKEKTAAAEAARLELETTLSGLRDSLAAAQAALAAASTVEQRTKARETVEAAQKDLKKVQMDLQGQPESPARAAADNALKAVDTALERTAAALRDTASGTGLLSLASMHTSLDRAQSALATAQAEITKALAAAGSDSALGTLLSQAQATLSTAQISLLPLLRQELADAQDDLKTARDKVTELEGDLAEAEADLAEAEADLAEAKRDNTDDVARLEKARDEKQEEVDRLKLSLNTATAERDKQQERADTYDPRVTLADALEPAAPGGARVNRGEKNADITYMARTSHTGKDAPTAAPTVVDDSNPTPEESAALAAYNAQFAYPYWDADGMAVDDLADAAAAGPLKIRMAAVRHADGKRLFGAGRSSDELPLRGFTLRHDVRDAAEVVIAGGATLSNANRVLPFQGRETIGDADTGFDLTDSTWRNYEATYRSSIQLPSSGTSGPTLKMGGQGVIFYDLEQRRRAVGSYCPSGQTGTYCDDATTDDVQVAFTSQAVRDPSGYPAWYWDTDVPFDPAGRNSGLFDDDAYVLGADVTDANNADFGDSDDATDGGYTGPADIDRVGLLDIDGDGKADLRVFDTSYGATPTYRVRPLYDTPRHMCGQIWCNPDDPRDSGRIQPSQGEYQFLLSNYAGENAETAATDDHRYLQYASYGLFAFYDYILAGPFERAGYPRPARLQAFHFGYDAFADEDGMKTTDLASPITATFKGATTGWLFPGSDLVSKNDHIRDPIRMRGEVELMATIGGANEISGYMRNFEFLRNGVWRTNPGQVEVDPLPNAARSEGVLGYVHTGYTEAELGNAVRLKMGNIAADGSYKGIAQAIHTGSGDSDRPGGGGTHFFQDGEYEGNFYGPRTSLETAGAWYLPEHLNIAGGARGGMGSIVGAFGAKSVPEE